MAANHTNNWRKIKLKEVCREITVGFVGPMVTEYVSTGIPFLRSQNVRPFKFDPGGLQFITPQFHAKLRKSILLPGDVVVTRSGANTGQCCVIPQQLREANCADLVVIRPSDEADSWFLMYLINSAWGRATIAGSVVGAAQHHFNIGVAKEMLINLPPINIQRLVSSILKTYDDLIENNTRRIQILEEMARMIYREWFVNFRFPGYEKAKFVESQLGRIPEGWEIKKLADVCTLVMGQSPESKFYNEKGDGLPFHQGVTDFGEHFPTTRVYCTVRNRLAQTGDILFSVRAPVGRINIANQEIIIGRGLSAIRSKNGNQTFIYRQLREKFFEDDIMGGGTIFKSVTKSDLEDVQILHPDEGTIRLFENHCTPLHSQIATLTKKNLNLRQTRDLLLPKLISGQVDVSDLDIQV